LPDNKNKSLARRSLHMMELFLIIFSGVSAALVVVEAVVKKDDK
jgi:hypothetical protein